MSAQAVALAHEGDLLAIPGPARSSLGAGVRGEACGAAAGRAHGPDVGASGGERREHDPVGGEGGDRTGRGHGLGSGGLGGRGREVAGGGRIGGERVGGALAAGEGGRHRENEDAAVDAGEASQGGDLGDGGGHRDLLGPWSRCSWGRVPPGARGRIWEGRSRADHPGITADKSLGGGGLVSWRRPFPTGVPVAAPTFLSPKEACAVVVEVVGQIVRGRAASAELPRP